MDPGDAPANVAVDCGQYDGNEDRDIDVKEANDNALIVVEDVAEVEDNEEVGYDGETEEFAV